MGHMSTWAHGITIHEYMGTWVHEVMGTWAQEYRRTGVHALLLESHVAKFANDGVPRDPN